MSELSDTIPPAPSSPFTQSQRVIPIGGVNHLVNARHGGFVANMNDFYVGQALIRYGEYGEQEWFLLSQLIRPGFVAVEVGANIGTHTVPMARAVGPQGWVIAVEPQRIIHQYLCANISLNSLSNVEVYHNGCGAHNSMMVVPPVDYFRTPLNNFGGISLQKQGNGEKVQVRPLDDIIGERHVHFVKIDVEGMETEVLRGAKKAIKRCRPLLYVENDRIDKSEELIRFIQHYQYRLFWHAPALFNPQNYFSEQENVFGSVFSLNMLCVPGEVNMNMHNFQEITDPTYHPLRPARPK